MGSHEEFHTGAAYSCVHRVFKERCTCWNSMITLCELNMIYRHINYIYTHTHSEDLKMRGLFYVHPHFTSFAKYFRSLCHHLWFYHTGGDGNHARATRLPCFLFLYRLNNNTFPRDRYAIGVMRCLNIAGCLVKQIHNWMQSEVWKQRAQTAKQGAGS